MSRQGPSQLGFNSSQLGFSSQIPFFPGKSKELLGSPFLIISGWSCQSGAIRNREDEGWQVSVAGHRQDHYNVVMATTKLLGQRQEIDLGQREEMEPDRHRYQDMGSYAQAFLGTASM